MKKELIFYSIINLHLTDLQFRRYLYNYFSEIYYKKYDCFRIRHKYLLIHLSLILLYYHINNSSRGYNLSTKDK